MLIKLGAPVPTLDGQRTEGMVANATDLRPGAPPPWVVPHCWNCRVPVERFTVDWIASPFYLPIQVQCHGKTTGLRIPAEEVLFRSRRAGGVIWAFTETRTRNGRR